MYVLSVYISTWSVHAHSLLCSTIQIKIIIIIIASSSLLLYVVWLKHLCKETRSTEYMSAECRCPYSVLTEWLNILYSIGYLLFSFLFSLSLSFLSLLFFLYRFDIVWTKPKNVCVFKIKMQHRSFSFNLLFGNVFLRCIECVLNCTNVIFVYFFFVIFS